MKYPPLPAFNYGWDTLPAQFPLDLQLQNLVSPSRKELPEFALDLLVEGRFLPEYLKQARNIQVGLLVEHGI